MNDSTHNYKLLSNFDRIGRAVRMRLLDRYPAKLIWGVFEGTRKELNFLAPNVPFIGKNNIWQINLDNCVMNIALYRTLKKWKFDMEEAVRVQNDIFEAYLHSFPKPMHWVYYWYYFSQFHQKQLNAAAAQSQKRQYPGDWVFTYVVGKDDGFDFGVDISECAILKLCHAYEVDEAYLPHLCKLDHAMSKVLNLGFVRQGTLAEGAPVCDCRWKRSASPVL